MFGTKYCGQKVSIIQIIFANLCDFSCKTFCPKLCWYFQTKIWRYLETKMCWWYLLLLWFVQPFQLSVLLRIVKSSNITQGNCGKTKFLSTHESISCQCLLHLLRWWLILCPVHFSGVQYFALLEWCLLLCPIYRNNILYSLLIYFSHVQYPLLFTSVVFSIKTSCTSEMFRILPYLLQ